MGRRLSPGLAHGVRGGGAPLPGLMEISPDRNGSKDSPARWASLAGVGFAARDPRPTLLAGPPWSPTDTGPWTWVSGVGGPQPQPHTLFAAAKPLPSLTASSPQWQSLVPIRPTPPRPRSWPVASRGPHTRVPCLPLSGCPTAVSLACRVPLLTCTRKVALPGALSSAQPCPTPR